MGSGGANPNTVTNSEEYDGSTWTNGGVLNTARQDAGAAGTQTDAIVFSGQYSPGGPSTITSTEAYNGTSWVTAPSVATGRPQGAGAGTAAAGLFFGGGAQGNATEEFTGETSADTASTIDFD